MSNGKISGKQIEILKYMKECILMNGYPPSIREICMAVGLRSTSSVHAHLSTLEKNGYIRRDSSKTRAIEIIDEEFIPTRRDIAHVPIVGTVAAGQPILAEQNIEGYFPIPTDMLNNNEVFMLRVKGDSMINAGIFNGDCVLVEKVNTVRDGEIIVALVEDSATVKTFYKENNYIRLQPENDSMDPIIVDDCRIIGKVKGLFRTMQ